MTPLQTYFFTRLDFLREVFLIGILFFVIIFIIGLMVVLTDNLYDDVRTKLKRTLKYIVIFGGLCMAGYVLVPSQKQMALIYVLPKIATADGITKLTDLREGAIDFVKMSSDFLKEIVEEKEQTP